MEESFGNCFRGGGVSVPQEKQRQIMGSWIPVTPEKPSIPTRSHPIPVDRDRHGSQLGRGNWQELAGLSNGFLQEMPNGNGLGQNMNPIGQIVQNGGGGGYYGCDERNRRINHIAGSYTQAALNNNDTNTALALLMQSAAFIASANRNLNRSVSTAANRPLIPNLHSHQVINCNQGDSVSVSPDSLLLRNQNHYSGFDFDFDFDSNPSSNLASRPLTPNMNSQFDSNPRDSNLGSLLLGNQNHYSVSNMLSTGDSLSQMPQNGFPIPYQPHYDLNSPPREADAISSITKSLQFAPITPDQAKKADNNQLSAIQNIIIHESSGEDKEEAALFTSIENVATQLYHDELLQNIVDSSSAAISTPYKLNDVSDRGSNLGIDLNKTPQQKPPRRRKYMPKVIKEGKPKRTPKPVTPRNTGENPTGKRKYVRKNSRKESATEQTDAARETTDPNNTTASNSSGRISNFDSEKPTGKRKYVRKNSRKDSATEQTGSTRETADPNAVKSCRRVLNFDLENTTVESQGKIVGQQEFQLRNERAFTLTSDSQAESCTRTYSVCGINSALQINQQNGLVVENQPPRTTSNLTLSMNQLPASYVSLAEMQAAEGPLATTDLQIEDSHVTERNVDKGYTDSWQNRYRNGYNPIQQQIHAEGLHQVVFQAKTTAGNLERATEQMYHSTPQSVKRIPPNSNESRGSKREYFHTIEHTHSNTENPMGSLLSQEIFQVDECCRNSSLLGAGISENQKKKKIENKHHTGIYAMPPCVTAVEDCLQRVKAKGVKDVNANGFTPQMNHAILNSYFESNKTTERQLGLNKFTTDKVIDSMACRDYLPEQQISSELHSRTERMGETNGLTRFHSFASLVAIEERNNHAPAQENGQVPQTSHVDMSVRKQNLGCTPSRLVSSGTNKMLKEQDTSCVHQKSSAKTKGPSVKQKYPKQIEDIIRRLKGLNLNGSSNELIGQDEKALVPYKGDGALVPYDGFEFIKKRKPRPKVDLDSETNRLWNLLMGKEGSEGLEGTDNQKEKWWEEERKVFCGRADSFIARMHLVQGDRRFSRWKGSVVDSVIGVFLTQNVSDHLSSSAFMSLAARFPLKSTANKSTRDNVGTNVQVEQSEVSILNQDDTIRWHENVSHQPICKQISLTHHESTEHQRDCKTSGIERSMVEGHSHSMEEEVISSQDSFDSSIIQGSGGLQSYSGSNSEAEDPINFASLTNLLKMEKTTFQEFYSHGNSSSLIEEGSKYEHKQSECIEHGQQKSRLDRTDDFSGPSAFTYPFNTDNLQVPVAPFSNYQLHMTSDSGVPEVESFEALSEESISPWPSTDFGFTKAKDANCKGLRTEGLAESVGKPTVQQNGLLGSQKTPTTAAYVPLSRHTMHEESISQPGPYIVYNQQSSHSHQHDTDKAHQLESASFTEPSTEALAKKQNNSMQHVSDVTNLTENADKRISVVNSQIHLEKRFIEPNSKEQAYSSVQAYAKTNPKISKAKKVKAENEKKNAFDWDSLRKQVQANGMNKERSKDAKDSLDYEAIRCANVHEISDAIKERGMNNMLAERIQAFLNRLVRDHGSIDLEWLRDVPPDKAKDYLLSIRGLGLKSVECVRLLTLHHLAFPVDTNVGRIAVRLGWVPLQPLPESLQLHLLEMYPVLESIQKYLWPRLCKLDQLTLYELHYQMITFGKVFCTKSKPNCNACPMRGECRHFASAFASARLALPGPEEKSIVSATVPIAAERNPAIVINPMLLPPPENNSGRETGSESRKCEPIIEVPATPEQECTEISEADIEDSFYEDPDEIPTIKLNIEEFTVNLQNYMQENNIELQEGDMSKALVALNPEAASIPTPKLKNVSRLRTEHQVYELPDSHPLLEGMDRREPDDPSPYLLAIWTPGETANSIQPPESTCGSQETNQLCNENTCFSCNSIREANSQTVRGTLLIPCRTAMRGSFPLNGTYFQVNEVFADHESSLNPIDVPRSWIWNLPRRTVYFGTSVTTIFKGLTTEGIQYCFWRGFVCVRGFDQKSRAPRPLKARLHFPASKLAKTKNENNR